MFYQEKNNTMEALFATISDKGYNGLKNLGKKGGSFVSEYR